jgi:hypothetical protein
MKKFLILLGLLISCLLVVWCKNDASAAHWKRVKRYTEKQIWVPTWSLRDQGHAKTAYFNNRDMNRSLFSTADAREGYRLLGLPVSMVQRGRTGGKLRTMGNRKLLCGISKPSGKCQK